MSGGPIFFLALLIVVVVLLLPLLLLLLHLLLHWTQLPKKGEGGVYWERRVPSIWRCGGRGSPSCKLDPPSLRPLLSLTQWSPHTHTHTAHTVIEVEEVGVVKRSHAVWPPDTWPATRPRLPHHSTMGEAIYNVTHTFRTVNNSHSMAQTISTMSTIYNNIKPIRQDGLGKE